MHVSNTDEERETEEEPETSDGQTMFKVTCGALVGTLHKNRFASGNYTTLHNYKYKGLKIWEELFNMHFAFLLQM